MTTLSDNQYQRGDTAHHPQHNRTGTVMSTDGNLINVLTTKGRETWNAAETEKIIDLDD